MILQVYAVKDTKVGAFATPFFLRARGEAVRSFEDASKDEKLPFRLHPSDYELWFLAEFDDSSGEILARRPERVIGANEFVVVEPSVISLASSKR
jgi:hypothetical protein